MVLFLLFAAKKSLQVSLSRNFRRILAVPFHVRNQISIACNEALRLVGITTD